MASSVCFCIAYAAAGTTNAITTTLLAKGPECDIKDGVVTITPECVDTTYKTAIITDEGDEDVPIPHYRVSGYFDETNIDFTIYLPKNGWQGRFFQKVYPLQNSTAEDHDIVFGADSGGYTNQVAGGGGYRADAAVAKISRTIAREYYNNTTSDIYGYIYGGSGGSLVTIGAVENTFGIWQGAVALVQAVPVSNPNNFCLRAMAGLVLEDHKDTIIDSIRPGGNMNPFSRLDAVSREVLTEVTELGVPLTAFEDFAGIAGNRTNFLRTFRVLVLPTIESFDPTYVNDFWTKTGYLGTENSGLGDFYRRMLYEYDTVVQDTHIEGRNLVSVVLENVKSTPPAHGLQFTIQSHVGSSTISAGKFTAQLDSDTRMAVIDPGQNSTLLALVSKGTKLHVDNRAWLAGTAYHRHQIPKRPGFDSYDYLRNADAQPRYPQRGLLIGETVSFGASGGGNFTGNITTKLVVMDSLNDFDAFPLHADWYKGRVANALSERFNETYRLYYTESADHFAEPVPYDQLSRIISYHGAYEQHLRDLASWVERGVIPPPSTSHTIAGGQVKVPANAADRGGIQPIVTLTVNTETAASVKTGESIDFTARIEAPPGSGLITSVEWDLEGNGSFIKMEIARGRTALEVTSSWMYMMPGIYYPSVRAASHRDGDPEAPFAQVSNLGRSRITVI